MGREVGDTGDTRNQELTITDVAKLARELNRFGIEQIEGDRLGNGHAAPPLETEGNGRRSRRKRQETTTVLRVVLVDPRAGTNPAVVPAPQQPLPLDVAALREALIWDPGTRSFRLADRVIKRLAAHAPNQVTVLAAFEEDGWAQRIDDPLPRTDVDPKRRLHDTIKSLNRGHQFRCIRFRGDGTGEGVFWEPV